MRPHKCSPKKRPGRPPKNQPLEDTELWRQTKKQKRQRPIRQKRGVDVSHESDNGASSSDDFVPGKVSGKGTKPSKNPVQRGRGRPRKILMAAALPPGRAEVEQRRQRSEAALAKADKEAASKRRKTGELMPSDCKREMKLSIENVFIHPLGELIERESMLTFKWLKSLQLS